MSRRICFEWDIETVDACGDVQDHDHRDTLSEFDFNDLIAALDGPQQGGAHTRLVLVRDVRIDGELTERQWAYVEGWSLPSHFADANGMDGQLMSPRFNRELQKLSLPRPRTWAQRRTP